MEDLLGIALLVSASYKKNPEPYILLTSNLYKAQKLYELLLTFICKEKVILFPGDELVRADALTESKEMLSARLYALSQLKNNHDCIVITNVAGLARFLPNPTVFYDYFIDYNVGSSVDIDEIKKTLIKNGYTRVNKIDQSLQFAIRGDIIDIFPINLENPIRIELFGDEIESIRSFDLVTQTSIKQLDKIQITPASEFILCESEISKASEKIRSVLEKEKDIFSLDKFEQLRDITDGDIYNILENNYTPRLYKYFGFLSDTPHSLLSYCENYTLVKVDSDAIQNANLMLQEDSFNYLEELSSEGRIITHLEMFQDICKVIYSSKTHVIETSLLPKQANDILFQVKSVPYQANKTIDAANIIHNYLNDGYKINVSLDNNENLLLITELLSKDNVPFRIGKEYEIPDDNKVVVSICSINKGFALVDEKVVFLSNTELFNQKSRLSRFDSRFKKGTILKSYEDLEPGDYVVHEYQGIGQFMELQTLEVDGVHRDYLKIVYFGGEVLYVPLAQFQLVRKYQGKEGAAPRLSHLHSKDWENTKKRIKEKIKDLANRLFNLYVERNKAIGFSFPKDDEFQKEFEDACEFELTKDQQISIKQIKEDMESTKPMDRLLCGDVGFGKTEVAFRAIFKAINSGKQVVMLCPTTLLARQHYENAIKRFNGFDIKIAVFSRLIPEKEQKKYMKGLADGSYHLAIGTHRLLSKNIVLKDLGLLVVDEEQRFGVEQKERLKELKQNVDVLTLSATPIPRTLQISLLGVRSMSVINTAPQDRMPIQTYVIPYKLDVVKELIERELGRNGQVFYLHNNVSSLYVTASKLQKILPDVVIGVVHGQMDKNEIEDVMLRYYNGEIQVLVCTSIIENGIDIPNANMIIVEDSQNYGLSQLYQIKGRVGRSDRIAYAYLMYNEGRVLNEKATKRLQAIQDFTELGSGYKIAQRDLLIRGAGDILGPEQAGFIDSIGLDLYIKLLNEAVEEKKNGIEARDEELIEANASLNIDAYVPSDYATDSDKIELYQEIMSASSTDSLLSLKKRITDIYGKPPESVVLLFQKRNIDILQKEANVLNLKENDKNIEFHIGEPYINIKGIGNILFEALIPYISRIKVNYVNHKFKILISKTNKTIKDLEEIMFVLRSILDTNKVTEIL